MSRAPNAAPPHGPRRRHVPTAAAAAASASVSRSRGLAETSPCQSSPAAPSGPPIPAIARSGRCPADDRQAVTRDGGDDGGGDDRRGGLGGTAGGAPGGNDDQRQEAEQPERCEQRVPPRTAVPPSGAARTGRASRERGPSRGRRARARCSRAGGSARRARRRRPRRGVSTVSSAASAASPSDQYAGKKERFDDTQPASSAAGTAGANCSTAAGTAGSETRRRGVRGPHRPGPALQRAAQPGGETGCRRALRRIEGQRTVDELDHRLRQVGPLRFQRGRAAADPLRKLEERAAAERMAACERLPQQHAGRPDVGRRSGRLAREALRGDVRERPRNVAGGGERLLLADERQAEVEDADVDVRAVGEEDVGRLHVAVDDPAAVRVGEAVEDLSGRLDRRLVVQLAALEGVTERSSGDVLVGDVDVTIVARERERAEARGMLQLRRGGRLALGARSGAPRAGHDLECDLALFALVEGVPNGAHPAASQRLEQPVPAEHQRRRGSVNRRPPPSP